MRLGSSAQKKSFSGLTDRAVRINSSELLGKSPSKIPLSPDFLIDLLSCLYCCMHNGQLDLGLLALEEIHNRAVSNLYPNVLLVSMKMMR